ncbi:MAG: hypothetical protein ABFE07_28680 [Armatimonadia bacterium]
MNSGGENFCKAGQNGSLAESLVKVVDDIPMLYGSLVGSKRPKKPAKDNGQPAEPSLKARLQKVAEDLSAEALPSELNQLRKALAKAQKGHRGARKDILGLVRSWGADKQVPPHLVGLDPMQYTDADRQAILDIVGGKKQYAPKVDKLVTYDPKAPSLHTPEVKAPGGGTFTVAEVRQAGQRALSQHLWKILGAAAVAGGLGYGAYRLLRTPEGTKRAAAKPQKDSEKPVKRGPELTETKKGPEPVNRATGN